LTAIEKTECRRRYGKSRTLKFKGNVSKRRNLLVAELLHRIHMVEAWARGVPLILEKEPRVQFREIAKLFITSFDRPSFGESVDKVVVTTQEN